MSALERIGFSVDWSNPLASKLDSLIRQAFNELGLDEALEKVTGDSELLTKVAAQWHTDALDMRGIVDDLVADRRALDYSWSGRAAKAFGTTMSEFEEALTRAMRAVRITAKLADKLSDLAERMQAVRRLHKARAIANLLKRQKQGGAGRALDFRTDYGRLKKGIQANVSTPLVGAEMPDALAGAVPTLTGIAEHHGVDTSPVTKPVEAAQKAVDDAAGSAERVIHDATGQDVPLREAPEPPPPARTAYDESAEPQRFRDRLAEKASTQTKSIQDTFG